MSVAVVTGGSRGLGRVLAGALAELGWSVVVDGRDPDALAEAAATTTATTAATTTATTAATTATATTAGVPGGRVVGVPGDVTDAAHRRALVAAAASLGDAPGAVDLVVNNASELGPIPRPELAVFPVEALMRVLEVNSVGPLALIQEALPLLLASRNPRVVNVTSDASAEAYSGWGGYGASKAALDHLTATLAVEVPAVRFWCVDPGDLRTRMHQDAFPGEDISDRPPPESVLADLLFLIDGTLPSGRYRVADLRAARAGAS